MTLTEIIENAAQDPTFVGSMSSNELWYGSDTNTRLTDVCATIAQEVQGKAAASHSHTGYAAAAHTHDGYADADHTHTGFASADHGHTGYAEASHSHAQSDVSGLESALAGKADTEHTHTGFAASSHTHSPASIGAAAATHAHDYAAADHTHTGFAASSHGHAQADITGLADALAGKADANHTHNYAAASHTHSEYAAASHSHTVDSALSSTSTNPVQNKVINTALAGKAASSHTHSEYAAASHEHDYAASNHTHSGYAAASHTHDYAASGHTHTPASIGAAAASHSHTVDSALSSTSTNPVQNKVVQAALAGKANASHTHDYAASGHTHTPASIGAAAASHTHDYLSTSGGTVNGDVNVAGVIRGNGQQAYYFAASTMSQTLGTNNATGGTNIACGPDATCNIGGAIQKTASVLPRATNTYLLGNANFRWKGIYSSAAVNVSSDERLKENIESVDENECAAFIDGIRVKSFNYIGSDAPCIGVIAQELLGEELAKFFVSMGEDGYFGVKAADLVFPLIAAVQKLSKRVAELEEKIR